MLVALEHYILVNKYTIKLWGKITSNRIWSVLRTYVLHPTHSCNFNAMKIGPGDRPAAPRVLPSLNSKKNKIKMVIT